MDLKSGYLNLIKVDLEPLKIGLEYIRNILDDLFPLLKGKYMIKKYHVMREYYLNLNCIVECINKYLLFYDDSIINEIEGVYKEINIDEFKVDNSICEQIITKLIKSKYMLDKYYNSVNISMGLIDEKNNVFKKIYVNDELIMCQIREFSLYKDADLLKYKISELKKSIDDIDYLVNDFKAFLSSINNIEKTSLQRVIKTNDKYRLSNFKFITVSKIVKDHRKVVDENYCLGDVISGGESIGESDVEADDRNNSDIVENNDMKSEFHKELLIDSQENTSIDKPVPEVILDNNESSNNFENLEIEEPKKLYNMENENKYHSVENNTEQELPNNNINIRKITDLSTQNITHTGNDINNHKIQSNDLKELNYKENSINNGVKVVAGLVAIASSAIVYKYVKNKIKDHRFILEDYYPDTDYKLDTDNYRKEYYDENDIRDLLNMDDRSLHMDEIVDNLDCDLEDKFNYVLRSNNKLENIKFLGFTYNKDRLLINLESSILNSYINVANGNFMLVECDFSISGYFQLTLKRYYNSLSTFKGHMGNSWQYSFGWTLKKMKKVILQSF